MPNSYFSAKLSLMELIPAGEIWSRYSIPCFSLRLEYSLKTTDGFLTNQHRLLQSHKMTLSRTCPCQCRCACFLFCNFCPLRNNDITTSKGHALLSWWPPWSTQGDRQIWIQCNKQKHMLHAADWRWECKRTRQQMKSRKVKWPSLNKRQIWVFLDHANHWHCCR